MASETAVRPAARSGMRRSEGHFSGAAGRAVLKLGALVVVAWALGVRGTEAWITSEDTEAARSAKSAADLYCSGDLSGEVDREGGREALRGLLGGTNVVLEILTASKDSDDLREKAAWHLSPTWLAMQASPIIMAIIMSVLWFFCCWSALPCCACCRCCAKQRETHWTVKLISLILGGGLMFGILLAANLSWLGFSQAVDGFDNVACTSGKLLDSMLSGHADPPFLGMLPLLGTFEDLEQSFEPSSQMMTEVNDVIDSTSAITDAVTIAAEVMSLLQEVLSQMPAGIAANKHECQFCDVLAPILGTIADSLRSGVGSTLSDARTKVSSQVSGSASEEMRANLRAGAAPLAQVKGVIRDTFGFFTDEDKFNQIRDRLGQEVLGLCMATIVLALCLAVCMGCSLVTLNCCERGAPSVQGGSKSYNKCVHQCACVSWCCGWFYVIFVLFIGGLLNAATIPLTGMCLVMDEMSSQLLTDIGPAIQFDLAGDEGTMIKDIVDQCIVASSGQNAKLLDIIFVREDATSPPVSMNDQIVGNVKDQIQGKFDSITEQLNQGDTKLATNPEVLKLVDMLTTPIDMMIVISPDELAALGTDPDFSAMFSSTDLQPGVFSSVRCADGVVHADMPDYGGQTIPGVDQFVDRLKNFGSESATRAGCDNSVTCEDPASVYRFPASAGRRDTCEAGNRYVALKQAIRDLSYSCDVFLADDSLNECDPLDMTSTGLVWTGGCVHADGTMTRKVKPCSMAEFVTYVQNYGTRIQKVMQRLDDTVDNVGSQISTDLKALVDTHIISPIDGVASGVTCGFIGTYYWEFLDGLCFQGVLGLNQIARSYIACAVLTIFMMVLMYSVWRRSIDNVNAYRDECAQNRDRDRE